MSLTSRPVLFDPYSGRVRRQNPPLPQRAKDARADNRTAGQGVRLSGIGRIDWYGDVVPYIEDWNAHEGRKRKRGEAAPSKPMSELAKFAQHFRLTGKAEKGEEAPAPKTAADITQAFVASNAKTNKPREQTDRSGEILGLAVFPHFYANLLPSIPAEFLDENGVVHVPVVKKERADYPFWAQRGAELRAFFNNFLGTTAKDVVASTGIAQGDLLNFCAGASAACRSTCLVLSGNNPASTEAVQKKANLTQALLTNPALFAAGLFVALDDLAKRNAKNNIDTVVRLNMLSDIPWYSLCPELLEELSNPERGVARVYFYDYTKLSFWQSEDYAALGRRIGLKPGEVLDLTFSFSGDAGNTRLCREALDLRSPSLGYPSGIRIALAFASSDPSRKATGGVEGDRTTFAEILDAGQAAGLVRRRGEKWIINLPDLGARELVDGDSSDYRIDDPGGCIVSLNFKRPSISEEALPGFDARVRESVRTFTAKVPKGSKWVAQWDKATSALEGAREDLAKARSAKAVEKAVKDVAKYERLIAKLEQERPAPRKNPLRVLPTSATGDAPKALEKGRLRYTMFQVGGDLLIGPHVPTVLED